MKWRYAPWSRDGHFTAPGDPTARLFNPKGKRDGVFIWRDMRGFLLCNREFFQEIGKCEPGDCSYSDGSICRHAAVPRTCMCRKCGQIFTDTLDNTVCSRCLI